MPQVLLSDSVSAELGGQDPWPSDASLFQPFEVEQMLLEDSASCLSVRAFLHMCRLPHRVEERANAFYMSPSGQVPFIKAGTIVVAEMDRIVNFVGYKKVSLTEGLDITQKADMRAYMSLVTNVLGSAEMYLSWHHPPTFLSVTYPRHCSVHPKPLGYLLTEEKRRRVTRKLHMLGWAEKTLEQVYAEVDNCCRALNQRLDNQTYFFGDRPCELDALVYGHLFTMLTTVLPDVRLASTVKSYSGLVGLVKRVDKAFFSRDTLPASHRASPSEERAPPVGEPKGPSSKASSCSNGEYDTLEDLSGV